MTITHDDYQYEHDRRLQQQFEEQEAWHYCLVQPNISDTEDFLVRFGNLPKEHQSNAVIASKNWGNKCLTQRMQQLHKS